jgi:hypothetical protein
MKALGIPSFAALAVIFAIALASPADNRTNGKGKWVFSSQLQGATVVRAQVTQQNTDGVTCRSALSPAKAL